MTDKVGEFALQIEQRDRYEFKVTFDKDHYPPLLMDEPPPLGDDHGPNPARVLAAAIGDCLSASLCFCLSKKGVAVTGMTADVSVELVRNERKRLRIGKVHVALHPGLDANNPALAACVSTFEDFCVVTQSVREGLDVQVSVGPKLDAST